MGHEVALVTGKALRLAGNPRRSLTLLIIVGFASVSLIGFPVWKTEHGYSNIGWSFRSYAGKAESAMIRGFGILTRQIIAVMGASELID